MPDQLNSYREYVRRRLNGLTPVFAQAAVGDFSDNIELPDEDDEFTELYMGVQVMLEVIRKQTAELKEANASLEHKVAEGTFALVDAQRLARLGSWDWDLVTNKVLWSEEMYRIFGHEPDGAQLTYDAGIRYVHPEDVERVLRTIRASIESKGPFENYYRIIRDDGKTRWVHGLGRATYDETGKPIKIAGTAQDITEQKENEEAMLVSEQRYRNLVQNARDIIFTLSSTGKISTLNPAFEAITGFSRGSWIGKPVLDILHPDDVAEAREEFREMTIKGEFSAHEWRVRTSSQEYFTAEIVATPQDLDGQGRGVLGIARDISDRKRVEEARSYLATIVQSSVMGIIGRSLDGKVVSWNPGAENIFGYTAEEALGYSSEIILPQSHVSEWEAIRQRVLLGESIVHCETVRKRKDGELLDVAMAVSPIKDSSNTITGISTLVYDITEKKKLQRLLERTSRQRKDDLERYSISLQKAQEEERRRIARELHDDIGQRASGIIINVELLEDLIPPKNKKVGARLRTIKNQTTRLIASLRVISANLHPTALDDFGLAVAIRLLCNELAETYRLNVKFDEGDIQLSRFDPNIEIAIYRITQESLANVAKHAGAKDVAVKLFRNDGSIFLTIKDEGRGFDPKSISGMPGARRGLGMISMMERTRHLGGTFHIESDPHSGTLITVEVPLKK